MCFLLRFTNNPCCVLFTFDTVVLSITTIAFLLDMDHLMSRPIPKSHHKASLEASISSIDSLVKLQAKSDFYVLEPVNELTMVQRCEKNHFEKNHRVTAAPVVETLPVILIILAYCETLR